MWSCPVIYWKISSSYGYTFRYPQFKCWPVWRLVFQSSASKQPPRRRVQRISSDREERREEIKLHINFWRSIRISIHLSFHKTFIQFAYYRSVKFRINLWGHLFYQNANQKLQGFLPYQTNKDRSQKRTAYNTHQKKVQWSLFVW